MPEQAISGAQVFYLYITLLREKFMKIGCPKEIKDNENRVGLTPNSVHAYTAAGHEVFMEKGAGLGDRKSVV
mgnify:CR=1 FL=1